MKKEDGLDETVSNEKNLSTEWFLFNVLYIIKKRVFDLILSV